MWKKKEVNYRRQKFGRTEGVYRIMKKVAILQSNYIPWKGYFDIINLADEFILYDDMQYTKRDWRNRNIIKTFDGTQWLTIPVLVKGRSTQKIKETEIASCDWCMKHWKAIKCNYAKAAYFALYEERFYEMYKMCEEIKYLSKVNYLFLTEICDILKIKTKISWSQDYFLCDGQTERLVGICKQSNADEYISGPAAKSYIDMSLFANENIKLTYMDYSGYKEYPQLHGEFIHGVTILDLIFNLGKDAGRYMKTTREM